jgi:hypothetical protein
LGLGAVADTYWTIAPLILGAVAAVVVADGAASGGFLGSLLSGQICINTFTIAGKGKIVISGFGSPATGNSRR